MTSCLLITSHWKEIPLKIDYEKKKNKVFIKSYSCSFRIFSDLVGDGLLLLIFVKLHAEQSEDMYI